MTEIEKLEAVSRSVLGSELDERETKALAAKMGLEKVSMDDVLVREGEARRTLFVLAAGRLSVCRSMEGRHQAVYQLREGECAGTRAFLDGSERKAMLRADQESVVLTLEPQDFESLVESQPWLVYKVMRALFRVTHANLMRMNMESTELRNYMMKTGGRY